MGYVRVLPAVLLFLAVFVHYFARVLVNMVILSMVPGEGSGQEVLCENKSSSDYVYSESDGREVFCWTSHQQSLVKGSFYYGYIWLQMPGGRLSEVYGARIVIGAATVLLSVITLVSPWATFAGVWYLIALRVLTGLVSGVIFPCMNPILVRWVSIDEHARFKALSCMGGTLGITVIYPLTGYLVETYGWQSVFYVSGGCCVVWCLLWFLLVTDNPEDHPFVSEEELKIIQANRVIPERSTTLFRDVPFLAMLKSRAVWAFLFPALANDFGLYLVITEGPSFILNVLKKDIKEIGFLSASTYLGRFTSAQLTSWLTDYLIKRPNLISKPNLRRMNYGLALLSPALGLALMGFVTDNWVLCIVIQTVALTLNGFIIPAWLQVIDVAPSFTGTISGFLNGFSSVTGFAVPFIAAAFVGDDKTDASSWRLLFLTSTAFYVVAFALYSVLAKFQPEPFNFDNRKEKTDSEEDREITTKL